MEANSGLIKAAGIIQWPGEISVINLIGDPGCDGLGAGIMSVFARALTAGKSDLDLIIGDMVPYGSRQIYGNVSDFINSAAANPVFTLKGNHDTTYFHEFFGSSNYAVSAENLLLVVLDNAGRRFTDEALRFCRETLAGTDADNIIIAFHYPPPNPAASNSINPPEWQLLRNIYLPVLDRIRYFISGHVHSLAETSIDGIPVLISGGGGARIEPLDSSLNEILTPHHIIKLSTAGKKEFRHEIICLDSIDYSKEISDPQLKKMLQEAFSNEVSAHFRYRLMAHNAEEQGLPGLAALFRALSDSEFYHAANHHSILNLDKPVDLDLEGSIENEAYEIETMYAEYARYAGEKGYSLAGYTFNDARNAEKVHLELLQKASEALDRGKDIPPADYYTCSSCGYTFETDSSPGRCPVCGAPGDKIIKAV